MEEHSKDERRKPLHHATIIYNEELNGSAITDYEARLINLMSIDGRYSLQNAQGGLTNNNYFSRFKYSEMFECLWDVLREPDSPKHIQLANQSLEELENSNVFKYSPYKALNDEQYAALEEILESIIY